jgi:hypothetical protein
MTSWCHLDCGGKRSATPLSPAIRLSKALSPLCFASAVQDAKRAITLLLFLVLLAATVTVSSFAQELQPTNTVHFRATGIFVDSKDKPLAAYQLDFTASAGAKIIGIEGGEHAAFKEVPFYDPKAMQHERVIMGAFSTAKADKLPTGKTRVATIHLLTTGSEPPHYEVRLTASATAGGKKIPAQASAEEKQRNENEHTPGTK